MRVFHLDSLQERRLANFRANRRALWSLRIFAVLALLSLFAEFLANDRPLLVYSQGKIFIPILVDYMETDFGGEFATHANYRDPYLQEIIRGNGKEQLDSGEHPGWILWPPIAFSYDTIYYGVETAPGPPSWTNPLGVDDQAHDVAARVIYGFRISVLFGIIVTFASVVLGIAAGAVQGYFGGKIDLFFQRLIEVWSSTPTLYLIMIISSVIKPSFLIMVAIVSLFRWTSLVGVVRAEFLRARNFEYVLAARALGVRNHIIMFRHLLPNAMVATLTMTPFVITGAIGELATLDFLGFGLGAEYPSLGELALQGKNNLHAPWLGFTAFFTFAIMLSLLVFIFEGVRDAFDPRKSFQ